MFWLQIWESSRALKSDPILYDMTRVREQYGSDVQLHGDCWENLGEMFCQFGWVLHIRRMILPMYEMGLRCTLPV